MIKDECFSVLQGPRTKNWKSIYDCRKRNDYWYLPHIFIPFVINFHVHWNTHNRTYRAQEIKRAILERTRVNIRVTFTFWFEKIKPLQPSAAKSGRCQVLENLNFSRFLLIKKTMLPALFYFHTRKKNTCTFILVIHIILVFSHT